MVLNNFDHHYYDDCHYYSSIVEEQCQQIETMFGGTEKNDVPQFAMHMINIKYTLCSDNYKRLYEYFTVIEDAYHWIKFMKKKGLSNILDAKKMICKSEDEINERYMKYWTSKSNKKKMLFFSSEMMEREYGIILKESLIDGYRFDLAGPSCDISNFVTYDPDAETKRLCLLPGFLHLDIGIDISNLPILPMDMDLKRETRMKMFPQKDVIRLRKTYKENIFQLIIRYKHIRLQVPRIPVVIKVKKEHRMCGIDLGLNSFATIVSCETIDKVIYTKKYINRNTQKIKISNPDIFKKDLKNISDLELSNFQKTVTREQDILIRKLVQKYTVIVIGNLDVYDRDFDKNPNVALQMQYYNFCRFRNQLIKHAFPRKYTDCTVIVVDEFRTSKTCSKCFHYCFHYNTSLTRFKCIKCNFKDNKDNNGARNILLMGLQQTYKNRLLQCS